MMGDATPQEILRFIDPSGLPLAVLVVLGAFAAVHGVELAMNRLGQAFTAWRMLCNKIATITRFAIYVSATFAALNSALALDTKSLFALAGTLGVALGFALKDVAASALAGLTIVVDAPFQVGDRIAFGGYYGEVKAIGLRSVRLVTLDDNLVTIPSNKFLTEIVASANAGALDAMVVMPFWIAPNADHRLARQIVRDAVLSSKFVYIDKPVSVLVASKMQGPYLTTEINAKAYVYDVRYEKAFASDVTDRVLRAFRARGIAPPSLGGDAPPAPSVIAAVAASASRAEKGS